MGGWGGGERWGHRHKQGTGEWGWGWVGCRGGVRGSRGHSHKHDRLLKGNNS